MCMQGLVLLIFACVSAASAASLAVTNPSMKKSTKGDGRQRRPPKNAKSTVSNSGQCLKPAHNRRVRPPAKPRLVARGGLLTRVRPAPPSARQPSSPGTGPHQCSIRSHFTDISDPTNKLLSRISRVVCIPRVLCGPWVPCPVLT